MMNLDEVACQDDPEMFKKMTSRIQEEQMKEKNKTTIFEYDGFESLTAGDV